MALEAGEWGIVIGVFLIIIAMMVYNQRIAPFMSAAAGGGSGDGKKQGGPAPTDHLSRFVVHDGNVVGEVVAVDDSNLIIKHQGMFRAVPLAATTLANEEVHVQGQVDWTAAEAGGQQWLQNNRQGQDNEVTEKLTRSEDVKSPAFEAFQSRTGKGGGEEE